MIWQQVDLKSTLNFKNFFYKIHFLWNPVFDSAIAVLSNQF